jgi:hypothetical protein
VGIYFSIIAYIDHGRDALRIGTYHHGTRKNIFG